jgi:site-specific recombinase XerD
MTSLRLRMLEDMQIRNSAINTQESYVQQVSLFARYFNQSPEQLGPEEIRTYQVYLTKEKKLATGSILIAISALRFLYKVTLKKDWTFADIIPAPKKPQTPAGGPQSRGSPTVSGLCGEPETPCHLDHLLRRRLARLRSHCSYTPRHRQQAHGRAGRTRQGNEGSLRDALSKTVRDPAIVVASGKA